MCYPVFYIADKAKNKKGINLSLKGGPFYYGGNTKIEC